MKQSNLRRHKSQRAASVAGYDQHRAQLCKVAEELQILWERFVRVKHQTLCCCYSSEQFYQKI